MITIKCWGDQPTEKRKVFTGSKERLGEGERSKSQRRVECGALGKGSLGGNTEWRLLILINAEDLETERADIKVGYERWKEFNQSKVV